MNSAILGVFLLLAVISCGGASSPTQEEFNQLQWEVREMARNFETMKHQQYEVREMARNFETQQLKLVQQDSEISELKAEINELKQRLGVSASVAFSARLATDTVIDENPIPFGLVDLNIGGGYDATTGVFSPPIEGTYLLHLYCHAAGDTEGSFYIRVNGEEKCWGYVIDFSGRTGVCTTIVYLTPEDSVVATGDENGVNIQDGLSAFVGHLISDSLTY